MIRLVEFICSKPSTRDSENILRPKKDLNEGNEFRNIILYITMFKTDKYIYDEKFIKKLPPDLGSLKFT